MFASMFKRASMAPLEEGQAWPAQAAPLGPSAHVDTFARDNLPPRAQWPDLLLQRPEFQYPDYLNAAVELTERMVERGFADSIALIGNGRRRTYKELSDWTNRLAHALVEDFGVKPGNRVLIRSGNNPAMVAAWLTAFTVSFDEFALALFLAGTQPTFPVYLFSQLRFANRLPIMIALAVLMMIGTLSLVLVAERFRRREI